jgi:hypothetical protein
MEGNRSNSINMYYLLTTGLLYGGKLYCKIDVKKDKHGESTVPYVLPCYWLFLLPYMSNIFRLVWLTGFLEHAVCVDGHNPKTK